MALHPAPHYGWRVEASTGHRFGLMLRGTQEVKEAAGGRTRQEPRLQTPSLGYLIAPNFRGKGIKNSIQWLQSVTPKWRPPCWHCAPCTGPLCRAGRHQPCHQPGISKCSAPSNPHCSDLSEPCSYEGRVFQDGEDWPLSRCAKCVCRNGVAQCFTAHCQPLFCKQVRKTASDGSFTDC